MQWFTNMKTRAKLITGFGIVCAIMAIVGTFAVIELAKVDAVMQQIATGSLVGTQRVGTLNYNTANHRLHLYRLLSASGTSEASKIEASFATTESAMVTAEKEYEAVIVRSDERTKFEEYKKLWQAYLVNHGEVIALVRQGKTREAQAKLVGESMTAYDAVAGKLEEVIAANEAGVEEVAKTSEAAYEEARAWLIGMIVVGVLAGGLLAIAIAGIISRPLIRSVTVLQAVAAGDFTVSLDVDSTDEVGMLAQALNQAVGGMRTALTEVRSSADSVASASLQLSAGSEEISAGAQEQASSLEETASSLEEMASTIKQSADNAQQANQLANGAREVAERGGRVVTEAVTAMNEINHSSKQIADIINTIDEIAFQTNLLALNAAVEAARAGEQGRGFAVVAAEVRNLAKRSATSAKEIKALIQDSVRKVENGSSLVNQSGQSLQDIVTSVKRVTDIVGEIAAASREQASGIDQINRAVTQMDAVTQANAGQTEELSGTAESLSVQAAQLQGLVARFHLDADGPPSAARPAAAPTRPATPPARPRSSARPSGRNKRVAFVGTAAGSAPRAAMAGRYASLDDDAPDASGDLFEEL